MHAYLFIAGRRQEREMATKLGILQLGTSEDRDAIKKQIEQWTADQ